MTRCETDAAAPGGTGQKVAMGVLDYLKTNHARVLFRPHHEMNQGGFWRGGRKGPEGTARLYRVTQDYLVKEKGLTNLIRAWDMRDMSRDFADYNPGDAYWDLFAFDVYGPGHDQGWYDYIAPIVGGKPMAIGECEKLPTPRLLNEQPRWRFFMSWAELYQSANVVNRDQLPKFSRLEDQPSASR